MKVYVDSSVVLRRILQQEGAFQDWTNWEHAVTSELLRVEVFRTLERLRLGGKLSDTELVDRFDVLLETTSRFQQVPIQPDTLQRASGAFPTPLGTLDAIHLATALQWMEDSNEPLTLLTHDAELALAARACGLEVETSP